MLTISWQWASSHEEVVLSPHLLQFCEEQIYMVNAFMSVYGQCLKVDLYTHHARKPLYVYICTVSVFTELNDCSSLNCYHHWWCVLDIYDAHDDEYRAYCCHCNKQSNMQAVVVGQPIVNGNSHLWNVFIVEYTWIVNECLHVFYSRDIAMYIWMNKVYSYVSSGHVNNVISTGQYCDEDLLLIYSPLQPTHSWWQL